TVYRGRLGDDGARRALTALVNQGQLLVDYQGHGSVQVWGSNANLLTTDDVNGLWRNADRLPFVVAMDCLNGMFNQIWNEESLAETMMRAPQGGAVAVWASSTLTVPASQTTVNQELFRLVFQSGGLTLGEAVAAAKRGVNDLDMRRSLVFFGDPAMRLMSLAPTPPVVTNPLIILTTPSLSGPADTDQARDARQAVAALATAGSPVRLADFRGDGRATVVLYDPE